VDPGYVLIVVLFLSSLPPLELSFEDLSENAEELKRLRLFLDLAADPTKVGEAELSESLEGSQLFTGWEGGALKYDLSGSVVSPNPNRVDE
jgi:hypothetical protein